MDADLGQFGLDELCRALTRGEPTIAGGRELSVVELLTTRIFEVSSSASVDLFVRYGEALRRALEIAVTVGAIDYQESVVRRLNLTAALLRSRQSDDGAELISARSAIDLFLREVPLTAERAQELSVDWRSRDIDKIRLLRRVKNLATPAVAVASILGDVSAEMA